MTVVGARPQFVKAAALSAAIRSTAGEVLQILVHTGQHYDDLMSDVFFRQLGLDEPAHNLGVGSLPHGAQTGLILQRVEELLEADRPDVLLVFGDTNSTLGAALAAAKLGVPVAHVEAGLRSFRKGQPEEINRVLTDRLSTLLYCPSAGAVKHLSAEGIVDGVRQPGDVMFDVLRARAVSLEDPADVLTRLGRRAPSGPYAFATVHRAENTDSPDRLRSIVRALAELHAGDLPVVMPVHPRTERLLADQNLGVLALPPVAYDDCLSLARGASVVLTDSGGLQKEAMWLGTPCVTLRDETEWPETVEAGWNQVVGADHSAIVEAARSATVPSQVLESPYGTGDATNLIVADLITSAHEGALGGDRR
jgi:UDP-N-acetylglucosamine 2-epimerase